MPKFWLKIIQTKEKASGLLFGILRYIFTAQDIGSYKPNHKNFDFMIAKLEDAGIQKHQILHTAESLFHDHVPANRAGLASAWIYRRHGQEGFGATHPPEIMPHYDFKFTSMAAMAEAHQAELRSKKSEN